MGTVSFQTALDTLAMQQSYYPYGDLAPYPTKASYNTILKWHVEQFGTHPKSKKSERSQPLDKQTFANKVHLARTSQESYNALSSFKNWVNPSKAPPRVFARALAIQRYLFYDEESAAWNLELEDWADELWAARADYYGGDIAREKYRTNDLSILNIERESASDSKSTGRNGKIRRPTPFFVGRSGNLATILVPLCFSHENRTRHINNDGSYDLYGSAGISPPLKKPIALLMHGCLGMGKTELAKKVAYEDYFQKRFGERRWFVSLDTCQTAAEMQNSIVDTLELDKNSSFETAIEGIHTEEVLIILDSLEIPWDRPTEREAVEDTLSTLLDTKSISIIATIRGFPVLRDPRWTIHKVFGLSKSEATDLFAAISGDWVFNQACLEKFVNVFGGMPLALVLMAGRAHGCATLEPFWKDWIETGTDLIRDVESPMSKKTSLTCSIEQSLMSPRIKGNSSALRLFGILGWLPAGLERDDLRALIGPESVNAEECLIRLGVAMNRGRLKLLPAIHDYSRRKCVPTIEDCELLASYFIGLAKRSELHLGKEVASSVDNYMVYRERENIWAACKKRAEMGERDVVCEAIIDQLVQSFETDL